MASNFYSGSPDKSIKNIKNQLVINKNDEEIQKYRDEYAKQFNYDFHAICQDIRRKQGQDGRRVVTLKPRLVKPMLKVT